MGREQQGKPSLALALMDIVNANLLSAPQGNPRDTNNSLRKAQQKSGRLLLNCVNDVDAKCLLENGLS